jgi:hypothetical protein
VIKGAIAVVVSVLVAVFSPPGAAQLRECASDYCAPGIPGPLASWPWTESTPYFRLASTNVELVDPSGRIRWRVAISSSQAPDLIASGDFTGDGVADFIFEEVRPASPAQSCFGHPMSVNQLVFVDGATGQAWRPVSPILDICWANLGYATHQLGVGTAYIGRFIAGRSTDQVVVFPYYTTVGWVLSFSRSSGWTYEHGKRDYLAFPSSPAFDQVYDATNPSPCSSLPGAAECYVENSHVSNAVFIGTRATPLGMFVLTSDRAVIYRPDFTPTADLVWNYPEGSGRNYGLVESHLSGTGETVTLIGGCSVAKTRDTMHTHQLSDDPCGLQHHFEYFFIQGQSIVQHAGTFFGWAGTDGIWQNRLEFPFPSSVPLTGGTLWSVFNLYRDGEWRAILLPNPADPSSAVEVPGWYVWGTVFDRSGDAFLAATRVAATSSTSIDSYVPPWQFDLLAWQGGGLVSVAHYDGEVPSLALVSPGPDYHASDGDPFTLMEMASSYCGPNQLMVETKDSKRSSVPVPDHRTGPC